MTDDAQPQRQTTQGKFCDSPEKPVAQEADSEFLAHCMACEQLTRAALCVEAFNWEPLLAKTPSIGRSLSGLIFPLHAIMRGQPPAAEERLKAARALRAAYRESHVSRGEPEPEWAQGDDLARDSEAERQRGAVRLAEALAADKGWAREGLGLAKEKGRILANSTWKGAWCLASLRRHGASARPLVLAMAERELERAGPATAEFLGQAAQLDCGGPFTPGEQARVIDAWGRWAEPLNSGLGRARSDRSIQTARNTLAELTRSGWANPLHFQREAIRVSTRARLGHDSESGPAGLCVKALLERLADSPKRSRVDWPRLEAEVEKTRAKWPMGSWIDAAELARSLREQHELGRAASVEQSGKSGTGGPSQETAPNQPAQGADGAENAVRPEGRPRRL